MFDTVLITATARAGEAMGLPYWAPMLPSTQQPTVEWEPGQRAPVAGVAFPLFPAPIEITLQGAVLDADRARYLEHGWRVRPAPLAQESLMTTTALVTTVSLAAPTEAAIVTPVAHPDAGYLALQRADGQYLTVDKDTGDLRWTATAGGWERFLDGGSCWIAPRDERTYMLAKGTTAA
jgi:hypothetical protein